MNNTEIRKIVTESLVGMIAGVTRLVPPADAPLPDFIQAPVDRAVERVSTLLAKPADQTGAVRDVIAERQRQISAEGYQPERDDCYTFSELALAAAAYACSAGGAPKVGRSLFRWDNEHWKPSTPRRDLVKAGALILAEIERLDRLNPSE